jgi:hypothetical protein
VRSARISACLALLLWSAAAGGQTQAGIEKFVDAMVRACHDGGHIEARRPTTQGDAIVLQALDGKRALAAELEIAPSQLGALASPIDNAVAHSAAGDADSLRACLQPLRELLAGAVLPPDASAPAPAAPVPLKSAPAPSAPTPAARAPTASEIIDALTPGPGQHLPFRGIRPLALPEAATASVPPTPPAAAPALSAVDQALGKLVEGNVAFATPDHVKIGKSQIIEAMLSVSETPSALMAELAGSGARQSAALRVSDKMAATLNGGDAFDVSPTGPQTQLVSHVETTTWTWTITPKLAGAQFLILTFDALISVDDKEGSRTVNTLRKEIDVEVGWPQTAGEWFDYGKSLFEDLSWLWGTILVPIAAFTIHWWRRRQRPKRPVKRTRAA